MKVGFDTFPAQGPFLGQRVIVCFDYDTSRTLSGEVVREDAEFPGLMLIQLDDGRVIRSTECQYRPDPSSTAKGGIAYPVDPEAVKLFERELAKALEGDAQLAPFPMNRTQAAAYHRTRAECLQWVLEMLNVPEPAKPSTNTGT